MNKLLLVISAIFILSLTSAITITPISTPQGTTSASSVNISYNITTDFMNNLTWSWNNTNYSLYDNKIVAMYNFNNFSALGENDTRVVDISGTGNNLTVFDTLTFNSTYGRANTGAFMFRGGNLTATTPSIRRGGFNSINASTDNYTVSVWVYPMNVVSGTQDSATIYKIFGTYNGWLKYYTSNGRITINVRNGSDNTITTGAQSFNQWYNIIYTKNNNNYTLYKNGNYVGSIILTGNLDADSGTLEIGAHSSYGGANNYLAVNGSIDDFIIWNRSLTSTEVNQLYKSQIIKYNSTTWTFGENANTSAYSQLYYLCSANTTQTICSTSNSIRRLQTLNSNFTNFFGNIRNDFYGANTHVRGLAKTGINAFMIDVNNDGVKETEPNYTYQRQMWTNAKMNNQRGDMYLSTYFTYFNDLDFEQWTNDSVGFFNNTNYQSGVVGWQQSVFPGGTNGTIGSSTDSHSGSKSLNLTNIGTSGILFMYRSVVQEGLPNGLYNLSAWVKTSSSGMKIRIYNMSASGYTSLNSTDITPTGDWQLVSVTYNKTGDIGIAGTPIGFYVIYDIGSGDKVLVDDAKITLNNNQKNYIQITSLENQTDLVEWAYNNNQKIYYIADNPSSVITSNCYSNPLNYCNWTYNYSSFYLPSVIDFLNQTTKNGLYSSTVLVEVGNEPYFYSNWYANISYDNVSGALGYVNFFNETIKAIKGVYPNINVGGPSGFRNAPILSQTFLSNMSLMTYPADFHSIHPYGYNFVNGLEQYVDVNNYIGNCTAYGVNCSHMVISEWSVGNTTMKNSSANSNAYKASWAQSYISLLNNYPSNITSQIYQWSERYSYTNNPSFYPEYPSKWHMILDNQFSSSDSGELTGGYNTTKGFGNLCPVGGQVYTSSSDDDSLKVVSCKSGDDYGIIVINTDTEARNVTKDATGFSLTKAYMMDTDNGNLYLNNNTDNLGIIDSYGIKYLSHPTFVLSDTNNLTKSALDASFTSNEMYFSFSNSTSKHIASTLAITVPVNVTFSLDSCDRVQLITYRPHSGTNIQTFAKSQFTCNGNTVTLQLNNVEPSLSSNVIDWSEYSCTVSDQVLYGLIRILFIIGTGFAGCFLIWKKAQEDTFEIKYLIIGFVIIIIGIALAIGLANNIALFCPT